jgi:hypothetical protein
MNKNLFLASMPRAGTHLMEAILSRLSGRHMSRFYKPDVYNYPAVAEVVEKLRYRHFAFLGHIRYPEALRLTEVANSPHWCTLVLIRDPRDIALSVRDAFEVTTHTGHAKAFAPFKNLPRREQIKQIMNGIPNAVLAVEQHCAGWIEWADHGATLVRYEQVLSREAVPAISRALKIPAEKISDTLQTSIGQPTLTLNKGHPNRWRSELDDELVELFKKRAGHLVERLGYAW